MSLIVVIYDLSVSDTLFYQLFYNFVVIIYVWIDTSYDTPNE